MLSHKTFLKKTRRGKVIKVVREHYLRDDIGCGIIECPECYGDQPGCAIVLFTWAVLLYFRMHSVSLVLISLMLS